MLKHEMGQMFRAPPITSAANWAESRLRRGLHNFHPLCLFTELGGPVDPENPIRAPVGAGMAVASSR